MKVKDEFNTLAWQKTRDHIQSLKQRDDKKLCRQYLCNR
jgi:hypothetical protein